MKRRESRNRYDRYRQGRLKSGRSLFSPGRKSKKAADGQPSLPARLGRKLAAALGKSLKMVFLTLVTVAALAALSAVLVAAYLYVSKSDYFSVKKVTISGITHSSREEVLAAAGLDQALNILAFDPDEAAGRISILPWVDQVRVARQMPDTVTIEVAEHRPKLLVSIGRLYYLNERGEPFKELAPGENPDLPIVTGFNEDELLSPGPSIRSAMAEVLFLVETLARRNDEFRLDNVSEINYDLVRGLTLFTKNNRLEVKIGFGAYEEKFRRLGRVLAHLKLRGKYEGLVYINLEASPRVTVRYAPGSTGLWRQPGRLSAEMRDQGAAVWRVTGSDRKAAS
ncbi:MAG: FtsQ-type POTRA domain-containing protein [Candidatus Adiutrix sp.]|jgi:cell division septal protein FtsQ|nr:FtsQ-type POTRA domain-containing protein [Candidatus Adiutrix sp.]